MVVCGPDLPARIDSRRPLPSLTQQRWKQFGSFEGLDNRRDLWRMLERLDRLSEGAAPEIGCRRRRDFLAICQRALAKKTGLKVEMDPATVGMTREIYLDLIALCTPHGWLDLESVARTLERYVRELGL